MGSILEQEIERLKAQNKIKESPTGGYIVNNEQNDNKNNNQKSPQIDWWGLASTISPLAVGVPRLTYELVKKGYSITDLFDSPLKAAIATRAGLALPYLANLFTTKPSSIDFMIDPLLYAVRAGLPYAKNIAKSIGTGMIGAGHWAKNLLFPPSTPVDLLPEMTNEQVMKEMLKLSGQRIRKEYLYNLKNLTKQVAPEIKQGVPAGGLAALATMPVSAPVAATTIGLAATPAAIQGIRAMLSMLAEKRAIDTANEMAARAMAANAKFNTNPKWFMNRDINKEFENFIK